MAGRWEMSTTALRREIGYVIQQTGLFPHMRVADNIAVVPKLLGWKRDAISQRVDELLDLVELPAQSTGDVTRPNSRAGSSSGSGWHGRWQGTRRHC